MAVILSFFIFITHFKFFALCQLVDFAKTLLYVDVSKYDTWRNKSWSRRKQGVDLAGISRFKEAHVLGRVTPVE